MNEWEKKIIEVSESLHILSARLIDVPSSIAKIFDKLEGLQKQNETAIKEMEYKVALLKSDIDNIGQSGRTHREKIIAKVETLEKKTVKIEETQGILTPLINILKLPKWLKVLLTIGVLSMLIQESRTIILHFIASLKFW